MGRKPLSILSPTIILHIRVTEEANERIKEFVGPKNVANFVRDAIEREFRRLDKNEAKRLGRAAKKESEGSTSK